MLHMTKLAVGIRDIAHLRQVQDARRRHAPDLRHQTRNHPRRATEIAGEGSMYWVVAGAILVRQRILDVVDDHWDDGSACAAIVLDPELVQVEGRPTRPFQGWRYLDPAAAPPDLTESDFAPEAIPPALRNELRALCLI